MTCADNERVHDLRRAMYSWRADPVGGRTRLVKDIAREHGATKHEITRVYARVSAGLRPNALDYQDLDAYAAAWRDALVKELHAYKATAHHCFSVVLERRRDEARFLRMMKGAKMHHKARAHRAWRRNAERMARKWAR
jgi:predicted site-specific integrase-resolvase